ncbi:YitT family protein [Lachnoclostridium sp. Marseille-P6806]|uniref:YitT family protein n=1 Tax=Lachnoclostridium sp. Marseille-P6806 TaxID=2364793 RepID=UPI00102FB436|nr:YitT family protein [Lachnoclostridium sp. Marseille-P6806]
MKKVWKKVNWKRERVIMVGELAGCFLAAIGTYNFAVSFDVPLTGVSGIAMILYRLFDLPLGWMNFFLNIPLALLCVRVLGKRFFLRSIRCMIISSVMVDYVAPLLPVYQGDRMLATLGAGALLGLGYGLIYRQNSSSGGTDFISVAIKSRFPHLSMGLIEFLIAFAVLALNTVIFDDFDGILYGLVTSFIMSEVINRLLVGANEGTVNLIVTDHPTEICSMIDGLLDRGSTIIEASGGFRGDKRSVVLCVTSQKQVAVLQQAIRKEDPASFAVQIPCSEIHGEGFRVLSLGHVED